MEIIKVKRNILAIYFLCKGIIQYLKKDIFHFIQTVVIIDHLSTKISLFLARILYKVLAPKYDIKKILTKTQLALIKNRFDNNPFFLYKNIIVIKPYVQENEKGIILINYSEIINYLPVCFDLDRLLMRYHLVLEPSTESPYQLYNKTIPASKSHIFISSLSLREIDIHSRHGFTPISICAGDWASEKSFHFLDEQIQYDFCVVANFIPVKRYPLLLKTIRKYWTGDLKFAVMCSGWGADFNRQAIEKLFQSYNLLDKVDIFVDIKQDQVNVILNRSKCHVLFSEREGANRASFESILTGTPALVPKKHIGFPTNRFSEPHVFYFDSNKGLVKLIKSINITADKRRNNAEAALKITGVNRANEILESEIKQQLTSAGESWTVNITRTLTVVHKFYSNPSDCLHFNDDYNYLESCSVDNSYFAKKALEYHLRGNA